MIIDNLWWWVTVASDSWWFSLRSESVVLLVLCCTELNSRSAMADDEFDGDEYVNIIASLPVFLGCCSVVIHT